jgi:hypothetical protein
LKGFYIFDIAEIEKAWHWKDQIKTIKNTKKTLTIDDNYYKLYSKKKRI